MNQVGSNEACSQNFSFLALNTTEQAAPQISAKVLRDRRTFFCSKLVFIFRIYEMYKGKYWFHSKNFEIFFCSKHGFLLIKSHKT
jgi:hypothetical protein